MKTFSQLKRKHLIKIISVFLICTIVFSAACQSKKTVDTPENLFVVKSPADGIISKVLVSEGAKVGKDAVLVEIEVKSETLNDPINERPKNNTDINLQAVESEVENTEREVERTSVEVQRVESLVSSNSAPQSQLDAAQADFQKAQKNLQNMREKKKSQETAILIEKSRGQNSISENAPQNKTVTARVPVEGILKVINARVGQKVKTGQPLATVSQN